MREMGRAITKICKKNKKMIALKVVEAQLNDATKAAWGTGGLAGVAAVAQSCKINVVSIVTGHGRSTEKKGWISRLINVSFLNTTYYLGTKGS